MDARSAEERINTLLRYFLRENQGLWNDLDNLQGQLRQQELGHHQDLAVALCEINRNTTHIEEMAQQMGNPFDHPQHPVNSNESIGSRLPSTFQSTASNEHPLVPPASPMAPAWSNPGEGNQQP
jgi:hypothetical protein